jgi:membrane fusion protein, multidrug efflux system
LRSSQRSRAPVVVAAHWAKEYVRVTKHRRYVFAALLSVLAACSSAPDSEGTAARGRKEVVPVRVGQAIQKDVPVQVRAIGNVEPYSTVTVKTLVDGQLAKVHFQEGDRVNKDDLLFTIDPRPFEAALQQAKANLARDIASAKNAALDETRQATLLKQNLIAQSQYDQAHAQAQSLRATVAADRAAVENAKLQLQYCYIHSPISGRIGQLLVHQGNVVKTNDTMLAVINQVRPVYVSFSVPEQQLPGIRRRFAKEKLAVQAFLPEDNRDPITGELSFINNTVDTNTGTILMKGLFSNENEALWPGQFVDVRLTLAVNRNAVVVPSQAIEAGQQGQYVYVVGKDLTVSLQPVVTGAVVGPDTVVSKGLSPGQQVVTDGQVRLAPGFKVEIKSGAPAEPVQASGASAQ